MPRSCSIRAAIAAYLSLIAACGGGDQVLAGDESPAARADAGTQASADASQSSEAMPGESDAAIRPNAAVASSPDCDLNGFWIARQQTVNVALSLPQTANNWYFFELRHEGDDFTVVDHFDCGIEVLGTVHVEMMPATVRSLIPHNLQQGRRGTMTKSERGCDFKIDRFWSVRGMSEATYAPDDRSTQDSVAMLASQKPLPSPSNPAGAEDWDGDGKLGIAWYVQGIVSGERHSSQRDYTEWFSDDEFTIAPSSSWSNDFVVRSQIASEEVVFEASPPTVGGSGAPDGSAKHRVTFHFLGRDRNTAEARKILKVEPFDTCMAIREVLPASKL